MGLIQGVINGDPSVMLRGKHDIVRDDPDKKTKAKLYMALIGLQAFRDKSDRKRLEEYLHPISQKMQSEKSKIRSLLLFFTTGNRTNSYEDNLLIFFTIADLKEIINGLDLSQEVVDLLFVSLKKQIHNSGDGVEE
jgi:mannose-6-phosphate isomerase class I